MAVHKKMHVVFTCSALSCMHFSTPATARRETTWHPPFVTVGGLLITEIPTTQLILVHEQYYMQHKLMHVHIHVSGSVSCLNMQYIDQFLMPHSALCIFSASCKLAFTVQTHALLSIAKNGVYVTNDNYSPIFNYVSLYNRLLWLTYQMQLRSPSTQAVPPCTCLKQPVDGETIWEKHHMLQIPSTRKLRKRKQTVTF